MNLQMHSCSASEPEYDDEFMMSLDRLEQTAQAGSVIDGTPQVNAIPASEEVYSDEFMEEINRSEQAHTGKQYYKALNQVIRNDDAGDPFQDVDVDAIVAAYTLTRTLTIALPSSSTSILGRNPWTTNPLTPAASHLQQDTPPFLPQLPGGSCSAPLSLAKPSRLLHDPRQAPPHAFTFFEDR
jgi:hypothetical protein